MGILSKLFSSALTKRTRGMEHELSLGAFESVVRTLFDGDDIRRRAAYAALVNQRASGAIIKMLKRKLAERREFKGTKPKMPDHPILPDIFLDDASMWRALKEDASLYMETRLKHNAAMTHYRRKLGEVTHSAEYKDYQDFVMADSRWTESAQGYEALIYILRAIGDPSAIGVLRLAHQSGTAAMKAAAKDALEEMGEPGLEHQKHVTKNP